MYWYMPGLCREYVSSFDDCIPLETLSYEQLNGVSFSGVNLFMNNNKTQGSSQRSQGVGGPLRVDRRRPCTATPSKGPLRLRCLHFAGLFCEVPAVSRSQVRVKYIKHVVRDEGNASFSFSTSVICFQVRCHTATALWSLSHQRKPKFTEEEHSLKIHTPVERRGTTFNDGPIHQNQPSSGLRRDLARSVTSTEHGADHSFLATFLCLEELTINSATVFVCLF